MRLAEVKGFVVHRIHDHLYQRGNLLKRSMDQVIEGINHYGIETVVHLAPTKVDLKLEKLHVDSVITYVHYPITDGILHNNTADWLQSLAEDLALECQDGYAVLVHCNAGRNRSGLLNALVVRLLDNLTGAEALEHVRKARPRAIDNHHFENYLMSLGRP